MDVQAVLTTLQTSLSAWALDILGAVAVLIVGLWLAKKARRIGRKLLVESPIDDSLAGFFSGLIYFGASTVVILAVLGIFGIPTASFVAILGAAGLAVGLAFQGTLSNFASGVMLLTFRPFRVGDVVEVGGNLGTVRDMGVFFCILTTPDNIRITIPNSSIFGSTIKNMTANDTRRIDMVMGVDYGDDLQVAMDAIREIVSKDARVLEDPPLQVAVSELGDSAVNIIVRPWVATPDYWPTRLDLTRELKEGLEAAGCSFPFPQRDVHVFEEAAGEAEAA